MLNPHIAGGIAILGLAVGFLAVRYMRAPARASFPLWGWGGIAIIVVAESSLLGGVDWVQTFFTPISWTGYLLLADAALKRLSGRSRLSALPKSFFALAFWSVPLWLIFEAYNLRLKNWTYAGVPANPALAALGYGWSFATIWPAIFETAELFEAMDLFHREPRPRRRIRGWMRACLVAAGLAFVSVPVLIPAAAGRYLFSLVWVGFIPLLDPLNDALGGRSLLGDWEGGNGQTLKCFLASGLFCGIMWEAWNYWAGAKWHYIFPIARGWKIFEMPLPGYLGFAPFGVECLVMYEFVRTLGRRLAQRQEEKAEPPWAPACEPKP